MPRLIDAYALKGYFAPTITGRTEYSADEILVTIASMPTVDAVPIKRGYWKVVKSSIHPYGNDVACSVCGFKMGSSFGYGFCPHCGAKMDEVEDAETD